MTELNSQFYIYKYLVNIITVFLILIYETFLFSFYADLIEL